MGSIKEVKLTHFWVLEAALRQALDDKTAKCPAAFAKAFAKREAPLRFLPLKVDYFPITSNLTVEVSPSLSVITKTCLPTAGKSDN